jgi:hypothetical protein
MKFRLKTQIVTALASALLGASVANAVEYYCQGQVVSVNVNYQETVRLSLAGTTIGINATSATSFYHVSVCKLNADTPMGDGLTMSAAACRLAYQTLVAAKLTGTEVRIALQAPASGVPASSCSANIPTWSQLYGTVTSGGKGFYYGPELL